MVPATMVIAVIGLLFLSGCARYARTVDALYEPVVVARKGIGEVYIVVPESQQSRASDVKWVLGKVKDDENNKIDEIFSTRSPAETIQAALSQELSKAGYTVIPATKNPGTKQRIIDLTNTEITIDQISDFADLKATCRVVAGMDIFIDGQIIKKLEYKSTSSKTDIRDRDLLAKSVLKDALQSVMKSMIPDLSALLEK
jgi:uncharacterized lipoprotein YajG